MTNARIAPLEPPYTPEVEDFLDKWMPPNSGAPPLALFRTIARHPMLASRMRPLASGLLTRGTLAPRVRELLILRTSARCNARYEWGVHVPFFAASVGLDDATVQSTVTRDAAAMASEDDDDSLVVRVADELHDTATLSDSLFAAVASRFGEIALLEMAAVVGFYHLIAFILGVAGTPHEPWAAPFPE